MPKSEKPPVFRGVETLVTHGGRDPGVQHGFVNTPVYRGSTVVFPDLDAFEDHALPFRYGRQGTPLTRGFEDIVTELEQAEATVLTPSGVSAITLALMSVVSQGDDIVVTDNVYAPTRIFCDTVLKRMGVTTRYFDPRSGGNIADFVSEATKAVFLESPGSLTFELQDIPAIAEALSGRGIALIVDNTWATPLYYKPLALGADIVIHSGTKMFVGHSDALFGTVSANARWQAQLEQTHRIMGLIASPDDTYLATRGMRTLGLRMQAHRDRALSMARWLESREGVMDVLHPGLESHPDHALFARDFTGSGSLFSFLLPPAPRAAVAAFVDQLDLFGMGYSWGGYESLIMPADPTQIRSAVPWTDDRRLFRIHVGLEDYDDLVADLDAGIARYLAAL